MVDRSIGPLPEYESPRKAIDSAGFFSQPETIDGVVDRVVCASERNDYGFTGVSFWIAKRGDVWFVGAWGGFIYRVPDRVLVETVAVDLLRTHQGTPWDFAPELKLKYSLRSVPWSDFAPDGRAELP